MKSTTEEFIVKAKQVHNSKYDYSQSKYINSSTKVCIVCPKHGEFWQTPNNHLYGFGCKKCGVEQRTIKRALTTESFIKKANEVHSNKYQYDKVVYSTSKEDVCIICPIHGEFWQRASAHLSGQGCPICAVEDTVNRCKHTKEIFVQRAIKVHNSKYNYSKVNYVNNRTKICITCSKHGDFWQTPDNHLNGHGCPKCGATLSHGEETILKLLSKLQPQQRNRTILNGKEIDIYIPSLKLGVEYNGLYWHSEANGKNKNYHINKLNNCKKQGVNLIQIFEDEWINHRVPCEQILINTCHLNTIFDICTDKYKMYDIKDTQKVNNFLNTYSLYGEATFNKCVGMIYDNHIVGVITLKKRHKEDKWILNRFATINNVNRELIFHNLFEYFITTNSINEIKIIVNKRWEPNQFNNIYIKCGFKLTKETKPICSYFNCSISNCKRFSKNSVKKLLKFKYGKHSIITSKSKHIKELGFHKIWDCGLAIYTFRNTT